MSTTPNATPANDPQITVPVSKTKSLVNRGVNFVKTHKKATIAVTALSGLVAAGVILDKKTDLSLPDPRDLEINDIPGGYEVIDTTVA